MFLTERSVSLTVLAASLMAIVGAAGFEHIAKLAPCPLCLYQRWPFYAAIVLSALALNLQASTRPGLARVVLMLIVLVLGANVALGIYHSGVEWKWWEGPAACAGTGRGTVSAGNLLERLEQIRVVRCDEAPWRLFGLSLAGYSALISAALAGFIVFALRRRGREARAAFIARAPAPPSPSPATAPRKAAPHVKAPGTPRRYRPQRP